MASPDAWWHLSAGRWIWTHGAVPAVDPFSFTRGGAPWADFEWGFQVILYPFALFGDFGLWTAKALLLIFAFWPVDGLLRDRGVSPLTRALGCAAWAAAILPHADLRPDLVSAALFAWTLRRLSGGKASFLWSFGIFAVWANLHGGFVFGLALMMGWAAVRRAAAKTAVAHLGAQFCGAILGVLLNPYGLGLFAAFAAHAVDPVRDLVREWGPLSLRYPFQWPLAAALAAGTWAAWRARRREPELAAAAVALAAAALFSARLSVYWPAAAVPLLATALPAVPALALLSVLLPLSLRPVSWGRFYQDAYVARDAADFVVAERATLGSLRLFNTYEWGGYLGWKLGPQGKVFGDGRYLFHGQVADLRAALAGPAEMDEFARRYALDGFLIRNFRAAVPIVRVYPDGTKRTVSRPWYLTLLPRERWALVWWSDSALVFVDRTKVPAAWLSANEYRWLRPGDGDALADALSRGEAPAAVVEAEKIRHQSALAR